MEGEYEYRDRHGHSDGASAGVMELESFDMMNVRHLPWGIKSILDPSWLHVFLQARPMPTPPLNDQMMNPDALPLPLPEPLSLMDPR